MMQNLPEFSSMVVSAKQAVGG